MKKSDLSDKQIESLLRELPKVTDKRSPDEIYQNITLQRKKRRVPGWMLPSLAAGVALILLIILSPALTGWQNSASMSEKSESGSDMAKTEVKKEALDSENDHDNTNELKLSKDENISAPADRNATMENGQSEMDQLTAVYSEDLNGYNMLTYAIPEPNVQVAVPVTVLVRSENGKSWFELFQETMEELAEEEWGLAEYFPLNAKLSYVQERKEINIDVPADHEYGLGSASETAFESILAKSFPPDKVKQINFTTDGEKGIELGNFGNRTELKIRDRKKHAYYFYYPEGTGKPYIVPSDESFDTIHEAFEKMLKGKEELGLQASIPEQFMNDLVEIESDQKILLIKLADGSDLSGDFLYSLEAIMLTAKNFGYEAVRLDNTATDQVGPFNLAEDIPLPVGPNKKIINEKKR